MFDREDAEAIGVCYCLRYYDLFLWLLEVLHMAMTAPYTRYRQTGPSQKDMM